MHDHGHSAAVRYIFKWGKMHRGASTDSLTDSVTEYYLIQWMPQNLTAPLSNMYKLGEPSMLVPCNTRFKGISKVSVTATNVQYMQWTLTA